VTPFDQAERDMWAGTAEAYEASYAKLCAYTIPALLDAAGVGEGTRVLDVGTGTGNVAWAAARRGAEVTAIDAEPSMVELARRKLPQADVRLAIVPETPFADAEFDAVVGNFVLNHFGRPKVALAELLRVAKPGGRVAFTFWTAEPTSGRTLIRRAMDAVPGVTRVEMPPLAPADDYPRTEQGLLDLLAEAGLTDVRSSTHDWLHLTTLEQWWSSIPSGVARAARVYLDQTPETQGRIYREYARLAGQMLDEEGRLSLPYTALLGSGTV
jgi:SAM-dependent methyltransferase